jgi:hypothetical protein
MLKKCSCVAQIHIIRLKATALSLNVGRKFITLLRNVFNKETKSLIRKIAGGCTRNY